MVQYGTGSSPLMRLFPLNAYYGWIVLSEVGNSIIVHNADTVQNNCGQGGEILRYFLRKMQQIRMA